MLDIAHSALDSYLPHGACWLWDRKLIALHVISDLLTHVSYVAIPLILLYIYRVGHLKSLIISYPALWRMAIAFIFFCGLSHLGNAIEIWIGGRFYYLTGVNKVLMAVSSVWFTVILYSHRKEIAVIARVVTRITESEPDDPDSPNTGGSAGVTGSASSTGISRDDLEVLKGL